MCGKLEYRFLDGAVRVPIYLTLRGEEPVSAWTGFYFDLSDEENLFFEWNGRRNQRPAT